MPSANFLRHIWWMKMVEITLMRLQTSDTVQFIQVPICYLLGNAHKIDVYLILFVVILLEMLTIMFRFASDVILM